MRKIHVFNEQHYHNALDPTFSTGAFVTKQQGGGLGSFAGNIKRYSIPVLNKYVMPHAKQAVKDIIHGHGIKRSIQRNALGVVQDIGNDIIDSYRQKGRGISRKRLIIPPALMHRGSPSTAAKPRRKPNKSIKRPTSKTKKPKKTTALKKKKQLSKKDIFS